MKCLRFILILLFILLFIIAFVSCASKTTVETETPFFHMFALPFPFDEKFAVVDAVFMFDYPESYPNPFVSENSIEITKPTPWDGYFYTYPSFSISVKNIPFDLWRENNIYSDEWETTVLKSSTFGNINGFRLYSIFPESKRFSPGTIVFLASDKVFELDISYNSTDAYHVEIITEFLDSFRLLSKDN